MPHVQDEISTLRRIRSSVLLVALAAALGVLVAAVLGVSVVAALSFLDRALA